MKCKIRTLLLAAVMLLALAAPAFADVMWEPYGNSFYQSHRDETDYENRGYLANGQKGYITVLSAPDSLIEVINLSNGTYFNVGMIWTAGDGTQWAVGYHNEYTEAGWKSYEGWVPMSELALIYDYTAFQEDHGEEFEEYDGSGDHLTEVCLYSYPGGAYRHNLPESKDYMSFAESFQHLYTDENGLRWTFVGYYMGRNNAWACIDDPLNENLGTDGYLTVGQVRGDQTLIPAITPEGTQPDANPEGEERQAEEVIIPPAEEVPAAKTWVVWLIPVVLVIAVAVVTAILIRRKNKKTG